MKERILYHCEICGFESESKEEVIACETRGKVPALKIGDIVREFGQADNLGIVRKIVKTNDHKTVVLAARVKDVVSKIAEHYTTPYSAFLMGLYGELEKVDVDISKLEFTEPLEFPIDSAWRFEE